MGSTAVLLKVSHDSASVLNLGDSKAFLFRKDRMEQISVDHTDRALLEQYGIKKRKPALTQHLGIEPSEMTIDPFSATIDIQLHDQFLICSDGLTDMVSTDRIEEILRSGVRPEKSVHTLINEAIANGGKDNITVIVSKIVS
jgi:protein phosphatase